MGQWMGLTQGTGWDYHGAIEKKTETKGSKQSEALDFGRDSAQKF